MYSPTLGRFIMRDPIEADDNLYRYCRNATLNNTDPTGLADYVKDVTYDGTPQLALFGYQMKVKWSFDKSALGKVFVQRNNFVISLMDEQGNIRARENVAMTDMHPIGADLSWVDYRLTDEQVHRLLINNGLKKGALKTPLCRYEVSEKAWAGIIDAKDITVTYMSGGERVQEAYDPSVHNKKWNFSTGQWVNSDTPVEDVIVEYFTGNGPVFGGGQPIRQQVGMLVSADFGGKADYIAFLSWSVKGKVRGVRDVFQEAGPVEWAPAAAGPRPYLTKLNIPASPGKEYATSGDVF